MTAISEDYMSHSLISANSRVNADICKGNKFSMHGKLRASHIESTDGRMMTDLFIIDWYSFKWGLKSLSENRVERLLHEQL